MKRKGWITGLLLIILASIAVIVRIYYINNLMAEVSINEDIYNAARVSVGADGLSSAFADGFHMQSLYICNLYLVFMIFGNFTVAGVYLNILYQILTVLLVYIVAKGMTNRYVGFALGLIIAILPVYINSLSEVTIQNMEIFIASLICALVISVVRMVYRRYAARKAASRQKSTQENLQGEILPKKPETASREGTVAVTDTGIVPVLDTSMKEILLDDLEDNKVQYIENPLPVPKRREHKEMDFAFEPTGSDSDYDIKDMTGRDFYDIE